VGSREKVRGEKQHFGLIGFLSGGGKLITKRKKLKTFQGLGGGGWIGK